MGYPVYVLEPRICFEVAVGTIVASLRIEVQHRFDKLLSSTVPEVAGEFDISLDDAFIDFVGILSIASKGQFSDHKLVKHDAD